MYENYKELDLYQKTEQLILRIYQITKDFPSDERFGLVSQIRRAAISVAANFVEGYGRKGLKEKIQFLHISLGSLNEIEFYLVISRKLSYISDTEYKKLMRLLKDVVMLFNGYVRGLKNKRHESGLRTPVSELRSTESGQSLIETILAIFILTTGLSSGLALAIFAFGSSSDIAERITAAGLSREGTEAVRMMRDTNWQQGSLNDCGGALAGQQCYNSWLNGAFNISGSAGGTNYRLVFDPTSTTNKWTLDSNTDYRLYQQADGSLSHAATANTTNFFRKLTIIYEDTANPYTSSHPLVLVRSSVWWHGKNCAIITDLTSPNQTDCKIISEEYLTNWRNY